jgi:hypothetical protein
VRVNTPGSLILAIITRRWHVLWWLFKGSARCLILKLQNILPRRGTAYSDMRPLSSNKTDCTFKYLFLPGCQSTISACRTPNMASTWSSLLRAIACLLFLFVLVAEARSGWNRDDCFIEVKEGLKNGTLDGNSSIFYRGEDDVPLSDPERPFLTIGGCESMCGKSFGWYRDVGPRLST